MSSGRLWIVAVCLVCSCTESRNNEPRTQKAVDVILTLLKESVSSRFGSGQYNNSTARNSRRRPFITLAFAQSLDGKIAQCQSDGRLSANLPISGSESLVFLHGLRSIHDGILIGRGTAEIDVPRLTNRLFHSNTPKRHPPRPIILDPKKRLSDRVLRNFPVRPIRVVTMTTPEDDRQKVLCDCHTGNTMWDVVRVGCNASNGLDLLSMLRTLKEDYALESIMVEGGAATLQSFIQEGLYDCVCITINPQLVLGRHGISPFGDPLGADDLVLIDVVRLGQDLQLTFIRRPTLPEP